MSIRQNGPTIRLLRKQRGWRLGDLAERVQCSYKALGNIESETANASEVMLYRLAAALGVTYEELLATQPAARVA